MKNSILLFFFFPIIAKSNIFVILKLLSSYILLKDFKDVSFILMGGGTEKRRVCLPKCFFQNQQKSIFYLSVNSPHLRCHPYPNYGYIIKTKEPQNTAELQI